MKIYAAMIVMASLAPCRPQTGRPSPMPRGYEVPTGTARYAVRSRGAGPHLKAPAFRTLAGRYRWGLEEVLAEGIVVSQSGMPQIALDP